MHCLMVLAAFSRAYTSSNWARRLTIHGPRTRLDTCRRLFTTVSFGAREYWQTRHALCRAAAMVL
jgi:hypothetical protein